MHKPAIIHVVRLTLVYWCASELGFEGFRLNRSDLIIFIIFTVIHLPLFTIYLD